MSCSQARYGALIRASIRGQDDRRGLSRWRTQWEEGSEGS